jgi:hypothetical protein
MTARRKFNSTFTADDKRDFVLITFFVLAAAVLALHLILPMLAPATYTDEARRNLAFCAEHHTAIEAGRPIADGTGIARCMLGSGYGLTKNAVPLEGESWQ